MAQARALSSRILWAVVIALVVISAISIGLFAYVSMNPHTVTLVSTSSETATTFITSTETATSYYTVTSLMTTTAQPGYPYAGSQNCGYYGCQSPCYYCAYNSYYNNSPCLSSGLNSESQCSGVLFRGANGCVELVIPVYSGFGGVVYQYYTLYNLPSSYPPIGSWVTVIGQLRQGYNGPSTYGAVCPGNYINITSIS